MFIFNACLIPPNLPPQLRVMYGDVMPIIELLSHANHMLWAAQRGAALDLADTEDQVHEFCK